MIGRLGQPSPVRLALNGRLGGVLLGAIPISVSLVASANSDHARYKSVPPLAFRFPDTLARERVSNLDSTIGPRYWPRLFLSLGHGAQHPVV